jgi:hypothetical protein
MEKENIQKPLFFACKREGGRAKQRPGESTIGAISTSMHGAYFTHPIYATLDDPLSACGAKRVKKQLLNKSINQ